eukprot:3903663-Prymnesium_polylepis.2
MGSSTPSCTTVTCGGSGGVGGEPRTLEMHVRIARKASRSRTVCENEDPRRWGLHDAALHSRALSRQTTVFRT